MGDISNTLAPGTNVISCPMIFAMYVLPCLRETAAVTKRYLGLLMALIMPVCDVFGVIPNKSIYPSIGSFINLLSSKDINSFESMSFLLISINVKSRRQINN